MLRKPSYEELEQRVRELELAESERKLMDETTQRSSELLSFFIKHSPISAFLKTVSYNESKVLYASDNYVDTWGIPVPEMIGKTMGELFPHEFAEKITREDIDVVNNGKQLKIYEEFNGKHYVTYKFCIQQGEKKYLAGYRIDITDLKQAMEDIDNIFNMSLDMICIADINTATFHKVNSAFTEILGYTEDELLNKPFLDFIHSEDLKKTQDIISRELKMGAKVINFVNRYRCKDGSYRWLSWVSRPLVEKGLTYAIARDITESKKVEKALQESERKYRNLYQHAHVGLFETNLIDAKIVACNQRYCDLAGFPSIKSAIGMDTLHLYSNSDDRKEIIHILQEQGYISDYALQVKNRLTGALFWVEFSARVDQSRGVVEGTLIDITKRRVMEEERIDLQNRLSRAEKMESLGILAGGVAHDLNNVLGVILGYAEMLLIKTDKLSASRPQLTAIMKGGQKAAAIVDDLLTLARRGVPKMDVLNLNTIIVECQHSPEFANLLRHHPSVTITTDLAPDLLNISGSSLHMSKSIYNLVSNASESMPHGGIVTIKTTNQYLDRPVHGYDKIEEGDYVALSVSDQGEGIDEKDINRIFEPFYTKKVMGRSGTGLGLAVVWGTVKDHQGYINIQSKENKGSTFTIYLPVTREKIVSENIHVKISELQGRGESILIVDDVKEQRDIATIILEELNYSVSSVKSGEEAVEYVKNNTVDLLVLDMIMDPGIDGLETFRRVLEIHPKQKAIIVSGFSESDRVKAVQSLGAGVYVKKPYVIEKLGVAVKEELDRS
ncbi:PAS domain S-box protein [Desulfosediminicola flagellatus]|uniref:PAS domain S-box protein n=1 Tax=Desulfosediminicola flagellatus TaxID=2569541 RepID=UPI0010ADA2F3|nr:PAS domain S-box protein [Desulfosediminicola flagellatus]